MIRVHLRSFAANLIFPRFSALAAMNSEKRESEKLRKALYDADGFDADADHLAD